MSGVGPTLPSVASAGHGGYLGISRHLPGIDAGTASLMMSCRPSALLAETGGRHAEALDRCPRRPRRRPACWRKHGSMGAAIVLAAGPRVKHRYRGAELLNERRARF